MEILCVQVRRRDMAERDGVGRVEGDDGVHTGAVHVGLQRGEACDQALRQINDVLRRFEIIDGLVVQFGENMKVSVVLPP